MNKKFTGGCRSSETKDQLLGLCAELMFPAARFLDFCRASSRVRPSWQRYILCIFSTDSLPTPVLSTISYRNLIGDLITGSFLCAVCSVSVRRGETDTVPSCEQTTRSKMSYPTLTPTRPLPGTYFPTPAPSSIHHGTLFQSKTPTAPAAQASPPAALQKLSPAAPKIKSETLSSRERAARTVNDTLAQEARYPDLDSYLSRASIVVYRFSPLFS
jgi:hypothetical protein